MDKALYKNITVPSYNINRISSMTISRLVFNSVHKTRTRGSSRSVEPRLTLFLGDMATSGSSAANMVLLTRIQARTMLLK